jgi:hypothetical protein
MIAIHEFGPVWGGRYVESDVPDQTADLHPNNSDQTVCEAAD